MKLYFSIDLESWAYPDDRRFIGLDSIARKKIDNGFVAESTNRILDLLAKYGQKITFFVIAELFEWYPQMFVKIRSAGHEVAYHTHRHTRITSPAVMRREILASRDFLKEFKPVGFRAPGIYLPSETIGPLVEAGFRYSSSVYGSYSDVFKNEEGLAEFPISTISNKPRVLNYPRPMDLGIFLKEAPFGWAYFLAIRRLAAIEKFIGRYLKAGKPVFMFAHNWQIISPAHAAFPDIGYKITHPMYLPYTINIREKFEGLLKKYRLGRMDELIWDQKNIGIKK